MRLTTEELRREIEIRKNDAGSIRLKVNKYCRDKFGIEDFFGKVDTFYPQYDGLQICLARQIATINIEHLMKHCLAEALNRSGLKTRAVALSLLSDSYTSGNKLKRTYTKGSHIYSGSNGKLYVKGKSYISRNIRPDLDGVTLRSILAHDGRPLWEIHSDLRHEVLGADNTHCDASSFFNSCLRDSIRNLEGYPEDVYVAQNGKQHLCNSLFADEAVIVRPPADWYYLFHLFLFVDGRNALLSTIDDNPKVSQWFISANKTIKDVCGYEPLIIDIPKMAEVEGYVSDLTEIPMWILRTSDWRDRINLPEVHSLYEAAEEIIRQFLLFA